MGYDAACTIRIGGKTARGTAWLEQKDLIFRGPFRVAIPLTHITRARADDGTLHIDFDGTRAEFRIGSAATKWAARITNPPSRLDKLGVKPGMRVVLVGLSDPTFEREIRARDAEILPRVAPKLAVDLVFYAADRRKELDRLEALRKIIQPAGAVWVVRPKGQKAITESDTMAAGKRAGLVDVKVVSFSDTHTAEKFVIPRSSRHP